ncbi:MAG: DNA/RNA non-specific endonuclease [Hespellia sp.]|nr:DNA/RNA non-specific endonuclease [Hespellia sp.]
MRVQAVSTESLSVSNFSNDAAYVEVHDNVPFFSDSDMTTKKFEHYSELDELGRCGVAYANICQELMPTEKRGKIGSIKPSGWQLEKYDFVDGKYLYNRCHLIGFQLAGENANEKNLITGTRYLNIDGMLPFETIVADYVKATGNHVLYRVTPIYAGNNLVASGVLMEGKSVEDDGTAISYCIYAYNNQPGIIIDYATGENQKSERYREELETAERAGAVAINVTDKEKPENSDENSLGTANADTKVENITSAVSDEKFVLNTNTHKFHRLSCRSVREMSDANKKEVRENCADLILEGYEPCKRCNP